jgi:TPR repeat protein
VVLKRRYGDCKDKSQLLVALYRAMGIDAQPVLLHSLAPTLPTLLQPSPASFNHAIVRVVLDGKPYFVDPTLQSERGLISTLTVPVPAAAALIVSGDTSGLVTMPDENGDEVQIERSERMTIPSMTADAQLQLRLEYRGHFASTMRQQYSTLSSVELKKMMLSQFERTYPGVQMAGVTKLSDTADGATFIVDAHVTVTRALKEENGLFQLAQRTHVIEGTLGIPDKLVRKYPLWLAAGKFRARYSLDVTLPNEARMVKEDDRLSVDSDYFKARAQLTWRGAHLNYYVDFAVTNPEVPPAQVPGLVATARKLDPMFESKLHFKPTKALPQTAKDASLRVLDILEKTSAHEDMQLETLRTGKIPELNFEESVYAKLNYRALCESMLDGLTVRKWNAMVGAPMAAIHKVIEARADKRTKDLCAARVYFLDHDLVMASKELLALAPGDDDPLTLMQAWADYHAHDAALASKNLTRFLNSKGKSGTLLAQDAVLALALARRLGMEEPIEITQFAGTLRAGAWPMPLFALLRGSLSAEALLASIEQLPLAAREHASMEAHFYIAQAYLAANAPRKADIHLNWFARYGVLGSAFEVLSNADKYSADRADPDIQASWKLEDGRGSEGTLVRHLKAAADRGITSAQFAMGRRYAAGDAVSQDIPKGLAMLESAVAKGSSNAMNELGIYYAGGKFVKQDNARALEYYRQGADNGNRYSAYNLGRAYWFGSLGLPVDFELAFKHMLNAAELEHTSAQFFLSRQYFEGKGGDKNDGLARFWAAQSYMRGDVDGMAMLGMLLVRLETDKEMRQAGLRLLASAAGRNNGFAQVEYARILLNGVGMEADPATAIQLLTRAAQGGNNDRASALLARINLEGLGASTDLPKQWEVLAKLEQKGEPDALYQLGMIYRNTLAGVSDKAKAADYFRRGADLGQREAAEALAVMLHTGDGIARNPLEAARYYAIAVRAGYPRAMNNLANMYEKGEGVALSLDKAMDLYRQAAQLGHPTAMLNLAELYENYPPAGKGAFLPLAYYMLATKYGLQDANEGLARLRASADAATVDKAQTYSTAWKPGKAMPEET